MHDDPNLPIALIQGGLLYGAAAETSETLRQNLHIAGTRIAVPDPGAGSPDGSCLDAADLHVVPGFIDLHVHGSDGYDTMDAEPDTFQGMSAFYVRHGVTGFMPTTTTAAKADIRQAVAAAAAARDGGVTGARILGVHVEGPFISPAYPGAQNPRYICEPDLAFVEETARHGIVKLMTVAPEIPQGETLVRMLRRLDIVPVMGHTAGTYAQAHAGIEWGISQATHTFNAMRGLHHREPGALGCVMQDPRIHAQLIADNIHVHPAAMHILALCKSFDGILLITDAIRATGQPEGIYDLGDLKVEVRNGACRLADGTLAGSVLTMERALANLLAATQAPLQCAWPASSLTAARSCGLAHVLGRLQPGYIADIALLTDDLEVAATIVAGRLRYLHPEHHSRIRT